MTPNRDGIYSRRDPKLTYAADSRSIAPETRMTTLLVSTIRGDVVAVADALANGDAVDERDEAGDTALLIASALGRGDIIRMLLAAGADPNASDRSGMTSLMRVGERQSLDCVNALLSAGADPRPRDWWGHDAYWHSMSRKIDLSIPFIAGAHVTVIGRRFIPTPSARRLVAAMK